MIIYLVLLAACSSNDEMNKVNQNKEPEAEEVVEQVEDIEASNENIMKLVSPSLPKTLEEIIAYPVGEFASEETTVESEDVQEALNAIPPLSEDADDQELNHLFSYLYSLFKMDYKDPKEALTSYSLKGKGSEEGSKEKAATFNVEIILDSSGSMANYMGAKTRMDLAKVAIKEFASSLPKEANISLRVYGHKGTGSDADKKISCSANELVYSPQPYNQAKLDQALNSFKPAGWTPLAQSLVEAQKDLAQYKGENDQNIVYVVSDGIETCDGDPVAAAKSLKNSGVAPVVNIIGFDMNSQDQKQLQEIAKAAGGTYTNVKNQDQLQNELEKTIKDSLEWLDWNNEQTVDAIDHANEQISEIIDLRNDWYNQSVKEGYLILYSLFELRDNKKITSSQVGQIDSMRREFYDEQWELLDELRDALISATREDRDSILDEIDEIYEKNVSR